MGASGALPGGLACLLWANCWWPAQGLDDELKCCGGEGGGGGGGRGGG